MPLLTSCAPNSVKRHEEDSFASSDFDDFYIIEFNQHCKSKINGFLPLDNPVPDKASSIPSNPVYLYKEQYMHPEMHNPQWPFLPLIVMSGC